MEELLIKWLDLKLYGIDWNETDDGSSKAKQREREKPFCEIDGCENRVSAKHGAPKPFCLDHVFENPYVQDLLKRQSELDIEEDTRNAKAFDKAATEYDKRQ